MPLRTGPVALPIAEIETAKPLSVPRMRRLTAELVRRMMEQGNAKMTAKHLTIMMENMVTCWMVGFWISAV